MIISQLGSIKIIRCQTRSTYFIHIRWCGVLRTCCMRGCEYKHRNFVSDTYLDTGKLNHFSIALESTLKKSSERIQRVSEHIKKSTEQEKEQSYANTTTELLCTKPTFLAIEPHCSGSYIGSGPR